VQTLPISQKVWDLVNMGRAPSQPKVSLEKGMEVWMKCLAMAVRPGVSAIGALSLLSDLSIFDGLQEGDHYEECLSLPNEHGSVIKAVGAVIPESTMYGSKFDRDFELHHLTCENRRPNIGRLP
jgi:hypothetical protein